MEESIERLRMRMRTIPVVRGLFGTPDYYTGSVLANMLGLQVMRVITPNLAWYLRRSKISEDIKNYVDVLKRDGVLIIPNFLSDHEFSQVREEFDRVKPRLSFSKGVLRAASLVIRDEPESFPFMTEYLENSSRILRIVSAVAKRPIKIRPKAAINVHGRFDDSVPDPDIENVFHADMHFPTVKVWYYLHDIDESNAALTYAKGSHKFTIARLKHEYDMSIRTAKLKRGAHVPEDLLAIRGPYKRNVVAPQHIKGMNITETHASGKANTLVVANNMGFHKRGEFANEEIVRETVIIDFRFLESRAYRLMPNNRLFKSLIKVVTRR